MKIAMNWTKVCKDTIVILFVTFFLYTLVCAFFYYSINIEDGKNIGERSNSNLIRASYPNYKNDDFAFAFKIFEEYSAPDTEYKSFIGYRRKEFSGDAVNIDSDGFRKSVNHSIENSVWFLGGSTIWGTGSDDKRTIPSYFSIKTGEKVLNLGESGFNSLQELIQLQLLLSDGYIPREVVFYDGVNDGYHFCQSDSSDLIRHAYTSRWSALTDELNAAREKLGKRQIFDSDQFMGIIFDYYKSPLRYFRAQIKEDENQQKHTSDMPISSITKTRNYLNCDNPEVAMKAANVTLSSWRSAKAILSSKGIPVWFVLQPTATYKPEKYQLDHIINFKKRAIVNEKDSYKIYYDVLRSEFLKTCKKYGDCSSFIDLSNLFFNVDDYLFLDTSHISPNGNEMVASALVSRMRN